MMKLKLEIDGGNDAMKRREHLVAELRAAADQIALGYAGDIIRDINGNSVGRWRLLGNWDGDE